jgi:hypothetical protein
MKKFFLVQRMNCFSDTLSIDRCNTATRMHKSFEEAKAEASRLAKQHANTHFCVLEACGTIIAPTYPPVWDSAESSLQSTLSEL